LSNEKNGKRPSFSLCHLLYPFSDRELLACFLYLVRVIASDAGSYENEDEEQQKKNHIVIHGISSCDY
jgi:hypothetical protein